MKTVHKLLGDNPTIWVFGYGSLLWKPDFRYKSKKIGYVKDYERRFYQGNITFRGKPGQPGRVANLVEMKGGQAWGVAYEISGRDEVAEVLQALYSRETASGGYVTLVTTFYPRIECNDKNAVAINRTNISSEEHNEFIAHEHFHDHHNQHILERTDSSLSDMSIDEISSNEVPNDLILKVKSHETNTYSEGHDKSQISLPESFEDHRANVDSLLHYLHGCNNQNMETEVSHGALEIGEHNHSLSFSHDPSKLTNDRQLSKPVQVLLYTATSDNDLYLGPDDITSMARQIVSASGSAGSNVEYVTKIADYVRKYIPEDQDSHLFHLDAKVREEVYRQQSMGTTRLQLGLADLSFDPHDVDNAVISEPVMAS